MSSQRFTRQRPCPVCGGHDASPRGRELRCYGYLDDTGNYARCTREELAGDLERNDDDTYSHLLAGSCRCGKTHGAAAPAAAQKKPYVYPDLESVIRYYKREHQLSHVATYDYPDERGDLVHVVLRFDPKTFRQARRVDGGWVTHLTGCRRLLYRTPELVAEPDRWVYVTEGEKDADRLAGAGLLATTAAQGAGKWSQEHSDQLRGRSVVILPDGDTDGDKHLETILSTLPAVAHGIKVVRLNGHKDVSEWLDDGHTVDELQEIVKATKPCQAPSDGETAEPANRFTVLTAREFFALPNPEGSDDLLGPLLRRKQRTIIGGHTGDGKSTITAGMLRALLRKEEFLGFAGAGGRALIIDLEQGQRSIKRMLREAQLQDRDDLDILAVPDGLDLDKAEAQRDDIEALIRDGHYDVVVLDPYYKAHTGDSNDERQTDTLMRVFDHWRTKYGFCLVMPAHCRKPNPMMPGSFTIHDIFGSSAFLRGAEVVIGIRRVKDGYSKLHFFKDRDGDSPTGTAWGLFFSREEGFRRDPADGVERDYLAELSAFMQPGVWYSVTALQGSKEKGGIGGRKENIAATLTRNPDVFEAGDKVAAGRNQEGTYYRLLGTRNNPEPDPVTGRFEFEIGEDPERPPVTGRNGTRNPSPPYIGDGYRSGSPVAPVLPTAPPVESDPPVDPDPNQWSDVPRATR